MKARWALVGAAWGALLAMLAFLPAAWLAAGVGRATEGRLLLADARGTVWQGHAVLVLTGGEGSRDAAALPGRLHWRLAWQTGAPVLRLEQACCLTQPLLVRWRPGLGSNRFELQSARLQPALPLSAPAAGVGPAAGAAAVPAVGPVSFGLWPVAWLSGLGAPMNTMRLSGSMQVSGDALSLEWVQGRLVLEGRLELALNQVASRLSTLDVLGDYRLSLQGDPKGQAATVQLRTVQGALQLSGDGQWAASRLRFNGQASAAPGFEPALSNLLNIIGRRKGELSLISIG
jgi:general secretion pathway protein N